MEAVSAPTLQTHLAPDSEWACLVPETLPRSAQKLIGKKGKLNPIKLPLNVPLSFSDIYEEPLHQSKLQKWIRHSMGWLCFGLKEGRDWKASYANTYISGEGNIITLGGRTEPLKMVLCPMNQKKPKQKPEALLSPI